MRTIVMYKVNGLKFSFEAISFDDGLRIARDKYNSMGLIGRYYISSSDGNSSWIN